MGLSVVPLVSAFGVFDIIIEGITSEIVIFDIYSKFTQSNNYFSDQVDYHSAHSLHIIKPLKQWRKAQIN